MEKDNLLPSLLEVNQLKTYFYTRSGIVKAVDGVSFSVAKGKTLGIVGESGSGKSVTMLSLLGLIPSPPGKIMGGTALFEKKDLIKMNQEELRNIRGNEISMIFQDPMTSLNPYLKISKQLTEGLMAHKICSSLDDAKKRALDALDRVGISEAKKRLEQYPHQFSGGMRQRVMIAMALITNPKLIIADEPTTALDVTIQAQILDLLKSIQKEMGLSIILITHDLGVIAGMADDVLVMYAGKMCEWGPVDAIFESSHHPYTQGLLRSTPTFDFGAENTSKKLYSIPGSPPDPSRLGPGCPFAPRCSHVHSNCRMDQEVPLKKWGILTSKCYLSNNSLENRA